MAIIGLEISLFLFAACIGYILAVRIGQSAVVGMMFIGIILGPSLLGIVRYDGAVQFLAEIGAILLLFVVGLECNFRDVWSSRNAFIAACGAIVPFIAGFAVTKLFGFSSLTALFVGTALTATSIAITAHVLKELGKLNSHTAKVIIGAAVFDDVLGLLLLAVTTSIGNNTISFQQIASFALAAVIFFMIVMLLIPFITEIVSRVNEWAESRGYSQITILLAMGVAFAYSAAAEVIGLSAIVGAFVAGVTLEYLDIKSYREGARYVEMIFSAIFFVSLGVIINLKEVNLGAGIFLIALIMVAVASKVIGCYLPAVLSGLKPREAITVGIGMIPRGEIAMIVALFGLSANTISQTIYVSIMIMAIVTTIVVPPMLKVLFRPELGFRNQYSGRVF